MIPFVAMEAVSFSSVGAGTGTGDGTGGNDESVADLNIEGALKIIGSVVFLEEDAARTVACSLLIGLASRGCRSCNCLRSRCPRLLDLGKGRGFCLSLGRRGVVCFVTEIGVVVEDCSDFDLGEDFGDEVCGRGEFAATRTGSCVPSVSVKRNRPPESREGVSERNESNESRTGTSSSSPAFFSSP